MQIAVTGALLFFITAPNLVEGAKLRNCHAMVDVNGARTSVRVDCDEWDALAVGSPLSVVRYGDKLIARSFAQGSFFIDLFLALAAIIGLGYFTALLALPPTTAASRSAALR